MTEPDILTPREAVGCLWTLGAFVLSFLPLGGFILAAVCLTGCHTYTVVPADYHAVPVRQTGETTYERAVEDATGWYVPDALMLEILDAK